MEMKKQGEGVLSNETEDSGVVQVGAESLSGKKAPTGIHSGI